MDHELPPWSEARERLFVALRPMSFLHALIEAAIPAQRSLPFLAECVALDRGADLTYVTQAALIQWEVPLDEVFAVARRNLAAQLDHLLEPLGAEDPPRIFRCSSADAFEGSRLVSLPLLASMRDALGATALLLAAPDRDTLLVATDAAPDVILRLAEAAEAAFRVADRAISPALYVFTEDGDLGPLQLVDDHPLRARVRRGHVLLADAEYRAQKGVLDARIAEQLAGEQVELFLASYFCVERDDGPVFSYATWSEGVVVLLPVVDLVVFAPAGAPPGAPPRAPQRADGTPLVIPWEVVEAMAGDLWEEVENLDPPRRRVLGYPDEETLAAMSTYAVDL